MEKKWLALIIVLCVVGGAVVGALSYWLWSTNYREQQKMDKFFTYTILGSIPVEFRLEISSDTTWSGTYFLGNNSGTPMGGGSQTYYGKGSYAIAMFYLTAPGTLTISIYVNDNLACTQTTSVEMFMISCAGVSPFAIFNTLALLVLLGIIT